MIAKQAIEVLRRHNEWRKGNDEDMVQSPALLTEAIDYAVKYMEKSENANQTRKQTLIPARLEANLRTDQICKSRE